MAWRWYKRLRLFSGLNANLSRNGVGWSWGIGFIRVGISPNGKRWVSIGVPGTGFRYLKYLNSTSQQDHIEDEIDLDRPPEQQSKSIRKWKNLK